MILLLFTDILQILFFQFTLIFSFLDILFFLKKFIAPLSNLGTTLGLL